MCTTVKCDSAVPWGSSLESAEMRSAISGGVEDMAPGGPGQLLPEWDPVMQAEDGFRCWKRTARRCGQFSPHWKSFRQCWVPVQKIPPKTVFSMGDVLPGMD